ncbi:hypothetical protein [Mycobacterium intracellulare]|uniref:hypothetical protein n=1 Tax=Mycobacterium intracellulare TaxID=1767 RepID=UPI0015DF980E|nr:hypothetical protein [Mycobacterium intracellulare]
MAAFTNSPDFGEFITTIRSLTSVSRKSVEDMGGPSERQQLLTVSLDDDHWGPVRH